MNKTERINVTITRIISPAKFWIRLQTDDNNEQNTSQLDSGVYDQNTNETGDNLGWVKGICPKLAL